MESLFPNRHEAGRCLAQKLKHLAPHPQLMVLALPRGGVPVAFEIARDIGVPLDVFLVRKLNVPGHEELAMGAIASGGVRVLNRDVIRSLGIPNFLIEAVTSVESRELARQERKYRAHLPELNCRGNTVVLVDDGLASGASMRVAVQALKMKGPERVIVAVPVGSSPGCEQIQCDADEVVCARMVEQFQSVGGYYDSFAQVSDGEVRDLLEQSSPASVSFH
ncbi:MAG TPA: phosphoribosyltransferase [Verrucomicrobiae bacterium]